MKENKNLQTVFSKYLKPTRRMIFEQDDPGQIPVTKVGGVPWWPKGTVRPCCSAGHSMSFIAQIRLSDVPDLGPNEPGLLSFHYCQECSYEGNMPQGWSSPDCDWADPQDSTRYDLTIFPECDDVEPDDLGIIAEEVMGPNKVTFSDRMETPSMQEATDIPELAELLDTASDDQLEFIMNDAYDFDESLYPDLVHIPISKLGGWPSWVQDTEWPLDYPNEPLIFVAQLSPMGEDNETWCCGLAYLFIHPVSHENRKAKLLLQYT